MTDLKELKRFFNRKIIATINGCAAMILAGDVFTETLHVGSNVVVLSAGQEIEIPLYSTRPISGDLTANGAFQPGDITFTPSPECHLSAHHCSLMVRAAPTSKTYMAVPVVVSESGATNTSVFALSVIHPEEPF